MQEREPGFLLDDLRTFGINADQWITAAQDEAEWLKTAEQGAERFMVKWIAAKSQGLTTVCSRSPNVTGRVKERVAQSKRARVMVWCTRHS